MSSITWIGPIVLAMGLAGIFINRFRGGWPQGTKPRGFGRWLRLLVAAIPYGAMQAMVAWLEARPLAEIGVSAFLVLLISGVMLSWGHGEQMDEGRSDEATETPNDVDKIMAAIWRLFGKTPDYGNAMFEMQGLALTGVAIHLPLAIGMIWAGHWLLGPLFLLVGAIKAPAYEVGHNAVGKLPFGLSGGPDERGRNPDAGEVIWGALTYATATACSLAPVLVR